MSDPLRVLLVPADKGACGLYRMIMPYRALSVLGEGLVDIKISTGMKGHTVKDDNGNVTCDALQDLPFDVIVYQRPLRDTFVSTIPVVKSRGIAVVVELDDDIERVAANNAAHSAVNPGTSSSENWLHLHRACQMADWMTVTTPALGRRYAPTGSFSVIPNYVPRSLTGMATPERTNKPLLGWSGTMQVHPHDLDPPRGAIQTVLDRTDSKFHVVGDPEGVQEALMLKDEPTSSGWVPLPEYPTELSKLDVGIVPLEDSSFNNSKSWLKGLEMSALGIPFVASPTPEYIRLSELGLGQIAYRPRDWVRKLTPLLQDASYRSAVGQAARQFVRDNLCIEMHAERWLDAWTTAVEVKRGSGRRIHGATVIG